MRHMPVVRILAAQPCDVRSGAFGLPEHRVVVLRLCRQRIGAIAFHLVAQGDVSCAELRRAALGVGFKKSSAPPDRRGTQSGKPHPADLKETAHGQRL